MIGRGLTFSISIPVRGYAEFIETALKSIGVQQVPVQAAVLDASADDSVQRVLAAHRSLISYGYHRPDAGQAAAIQEGWNQTTGDIVAWLNADDYYFPDALWKVHDLLRERPDVDVVYGHGVAVSATGDFLTYFPATDPNPAHLIGAAVICQPSCFVRRQAMARVGGLNTDLHYTMDWDLWVRLYQAGCTFVFMDTPLSAVRVHPHMKTLSGNPRRYEEIDRILTRTGMSSSRRLQRRLNFRHYDLQHRRSTWSDQASYAMLSAFARLQRRYRRRDHAIINGIESWTNRVACECQIDVPWYGGGSWLDVTVTSDRPVSLSCRVNQFSCALECCGRNRVVFQGARRDGYQYRTRLPLISEHRLAFTLRSRDEAWQLLGINFS